MFFLIQIQRNKKQKVYFSLLFLFFAYSICRVYYYFLFCYLSCSFQFPIHSQFMIHDKQGFQYHRWPINIPISVPRVNLQSLYSGPETINLQE